jgi:hypothetical protein
MAANLADEAQSWVLGPDGAIPARIAGAGWQAVQLSPFFMENPSLSGRGTAGAKDVPLLAHCATKLTRLRGIGAVDPVAIQPTQCCAQGPD